MKRVLFAILIAALLVIAALATMNSVAATSCEFPDVQHLGKGVFNASPSTNLIYKQWHPGNPPTLSFPYTTTTTGKESAVYSVSGEYEIIGMYSETVTVNNLPAVTCLVLIDQDTDESGTDIVVLNGQEITPDGLVQNIEVDTGTLKIQSYGVNPDSHQGTVGIIMVTKAITPSETPTVPPTPTETPTVPPTPSETPTVPPTPTETPIVPPTPSETPTVPPTPTETPIVPPTPTETPIVPPTPTETPEIDDDGKQDGHAPTSADLINELGGYKVFVPLTYSP